MRTHFHCGFYGWLAWTYARHELCVAKGVLYFRAARARLRVCRVLCLPLPAQYFRPYRYHSNNLAGASVRMYVMAVFCERMRTVWNCCLCRIFSSRRVWSGPVACYVGEFLIKNWKRVHVGIDCWRRTVTAHTRTPRASVWNVCLAH